MQTECILGYQCNMLQWCNINATVYRNLSLFPLCSRSAIGFQKFPPPTCVPHVQNVQRAKQSGHIQYDPGSALPSYIIPVIIFNIVVSVHACIHGHMHHGAPRGHTHKSTPLVFHLLQPRHHAMTLNININLLHIGSTTFIFCVFLFPVERGGEDHEWKLPDTASHWQHPRTQAPRN